jgi:hypothetical protein
MKVIVSLVCVLMLSLFMAGTSGATYIVDTGTPSNGAIKWQLSTSQCLAGQFTLSSGENIGEMQGWIATAYSAGTMNVSIYSDASGLPGALQFTNSFVSQPKGFSGWQGTSGYSGYLKPGTYWIAFEPVTFWGGMGTNPANLASPLSLEAFTYQGTWNVYPSGLGLGVRIEGSPAPLPGALLLLGPGLVGLAAVRRRFKK